jgi:hypothetical protein
MMDRIAADLRAAREAAGLTLADIADTTLINVQFLAALDAGRTDFLPQTYVRAFLREYAAAVGLSPEDILRRYDSARAAVPAAGAAAATPETAASTPVPVTTPPPAPPRPEGFQIPPRIARGALIAVGVLGLGVILWNALTRDPEPAVREIPFDDVRAEHERAAAADTVAAVPASAAGDSLILTATITDSVWLQLRIDDGPIRTLILRSGSRTWKASRLFTVTLGNAGGAEFTLNGTPLGRLGKPGSVVRARELSRATLTTPPAPQTTGR